MRVRRSWVLGGLSVRGLWGALACRHAPRPLQPNPTGRPGPSVCGVRRVAGRPRRGADGRHSRPPVPCRRLQGIGTHPGRAHRHGGRRSWGREPGGGRLSQERGRAGLRKGGVWRAAGRLPPAVRLPLEADAPRASASRRSRRLRLAPPSPPAALPPQVVLVADGQVTMGGTVIKPNVRKTRKIGEHAVGGFAGALASRTGVGGAGGRLGQLALLAPHNDVPPPPPRAAPPPPQPQAPLLTRSRSLSA